MSTSMVSILRLFKASIGCDRRLMSAGIQATKRSSQERPFPKSNQERSP